MHTSAVKKKVLATIKMKVQSVLILKNMYSQFFDVHVKTNLPHDQ